MLSPSIRLYDLSELESLQLLDFLRLMDCGNADEILQEEKGGTIDVPNCIAKLTPTAHKKIVHTYSMC